MKEQLKSIREHIAASEKQYVEIPELRDSPLNPLDYDTTFVNGGVLRITLAGRRIHWVSSIVHLQGTSSRYLASFYEAITPGNPDNYINFAGMVCFDSNGVIDTSFGDRGDGVAAIRFSDIDYSMPHELIELNSGALLVVGEQMAFASPVFRQTWMIARYKPDGRLDTDFANKGVFNLSEATGKPLRTQGVVELPDGKIIIAAVGTQELTESWLVRLDANGQVDNNFGKGGTREIQKPGVESTHVAGLKPFGPGKKFITYGFWSNVDVLATGFITMLDSEGNIDLDFGVDGFVNVALDQAGGVEIYDVCESPQASHLLAAGYFLDANLGIIVSLLMRYAADGSIDQTFNGGKPVLTGFYDTSDFDYWQQARTLSDKEGSILALGRGSRGPTDSWPVVGKFDSQGKLDTRFAGGEGIGSPVRATFFSTGKHIYEPGRMLCAGAFDGAAAIFALKV
jgi:uncharacterized delta-60 repeat protein